VSVLVPVSEKVSLVSSPTSNSDPPSHCRSKLSDLRALCVRIQSPSLARQRPIQILLHTADQTQRSPRPLRADAPRNPTSKAAYRTCLDIMTSSERCFDV
jgi:hypothetical protein